MHNASTLSEDTLQPQNLEPLNDCIRAEIPSHINPSTPWRWANRGIGGLDGERIKLQIWYIGRAPHTTRAAVRSFINAVTEARLARMARTQQRAADVTDDELEAVGLTGHR